MTIHKFSLAVFWGNSEKLIWLKLVFLQFDFKSQ